MAVFLVQTEGRKMRNDTEKSNKTVERAVKREQIDPAAKRQLDGLTRVMDYLC